MSHLQVDATAGRTVPGAGPRIGAVSQEMRLALVGLLGAVISAVIGSYATFRVAKLQSEATTNHAEATRKFDDSEANIEKLLRKSSEFSRLLEVRATFAHPSQKEVFRATRPSGESQDPSAEIVCSGTVENLREDFQLWIAVEVDGFIFFKEDPVVPDPQNGKKWTKTFREPVVSSDGRTKEFNLRLYAAGPDGSQQITNWLAIGNKMKRFEKIATIANTVSKAEVASLRIEVQP